MENLRASLDSYFDKLDERWRALHVRKQHQYTLYFFVCYLLLSAGVIFKVWYDIAMSDNDRAIRATENPLFRKNEVPARLQDTLSTILKSKIHERK